MGIRKDLPASVDVALACAFSRLQTIQDALEQGRRADVMFGGGGRYEADAAANQCGGLIGLFQTKTEKLTVIEHWRDRCPAEIDFKELLAEYGEIPVVWLSREGFTYLHEQMDDSSSLLPSPGSRVMSLLRI